MVFDASSRVPRCHDPVHSGVHLINGWSRNNEKIIMWYNFEEGMPFEMFDERANFQGGALLDPGLWASMFSSSRGSRWGRKQLWWVQLGIQIWGPLKVMTYGWKSARAIVMGTIVGESMVFPLFWSTWSWRTSESVDCQPLLCWWF